MVNIDDAIIAKYESYGEHFEILVDPDLAAEFRNPDGKDVAIEDLLAIEEIFKDSKKGDKASDEATINPQTGLPHPAQRIENAMDEAKVKVDPFTSVEQQVQTALKAIKPLIPIRFEKVKVAVRLPGSAAGSAYSTIHPFGEIVNEEWQQDGSWIAIVEIPGGLQDKFASKMAEISGGEAETKTIK